MANFSLWNRLSRLNGGTNLVAGDTSDLVDTSQGLTQLSAVKDVTNTGAGKIVAGTGTFVSGTVTVATGLTLCTSFIATARPKLSASWWHRLRRALWSAMGPITVARRPLRCSPPLGRRRSTTLHTEPRWP